MIEENAVARQFKGPSTDDHIDGEAALTQAVERRGLPCRLRRQYGTGTHGHEIAQPLGVRDDRGRDGPRVFAAASGWQEHAVVAQAIRRFRDLTQIAVRRRTLPMGRAEVRAITAGW